MKRWFPLILGSLLASGGAAARNPEPLRIVRPPAVIPDPVARVVLVHGIFEKGTAFRMLRKRLEARRIECFVPMLRPSDGRGGLDKLAEGLKRDIDARYGGDQPISIIAFSMGGLVSRHYLQQLGGAGRCETFITISSPHHGTTAAWCYPSAGARQMRPGSDFLRNLADTENTLDAIPITSFRTPLDLIILPADSSVWDRAENISHPVALHPLMLTSRRVLDDIESRILPENKRPRRRLSPERQRS